ncbi:MAG: hypothetical protein M1814_001591 [Vezdaea aestivalis]|nr:MAG: hypothetical protein M1814_001591 [Vezdaea aestivalis]
MPPCLRLPIWQSTLRCSAAPKLSPSPPFLIQIRGKKKQARLPRMVIVRLKKKIKDFGEAGSIVPIVPGGMRNEWLPRHLAEYVTDQELEALKIDKEQLQRDFLVAPKLRNVGTKKKKVVSDNTSESTGVQKEEKIVIEKLDCLTSDAFQPVVADLKIRELVPETLEFWRKVMDERQESEGKEGVEGNENKDQAGLPLYGSVTKADIWVKMKTYLLDGKDGDRVHLEVDDLTLADIGEGEDLIKHDRLKTTGTFNVEVQVQGGRTPPVKLKAWVRIED